MIYLNTNTFDDFVKQCDLPITDDPGKTTFLVLGAKKPNYSEFEKIKAVYRFGVGTDNIDFKLLKQKSIPVHFPRDDTRAILYDATANFTVYGILSVLYRDAFGDIETWRKKKREYIGNKIALVIGTGNIGSRVQEKLGVFMSVLTYDVRNNEPDELEPLIRKADVITIHTPLDDTTNAFFDQTKLSWVRDDALMVNTARGSLYDEDALYDKLKASQCRAFFDVYWEEPYRGKLMNLGPKKFFMTPHSASNTYEFVEAGIRDIVMIWEGLANG